MTDDLEAAPEAVEEVVPTEAEQAEASEVTESTEGEPAEVTAEEAPEEGETEEKKSRSARRREAIERSKAELAAAEQRAREAEQKAEGIREAAKAIPPPKQDDYNDFDQYQAALTAYHSVLMLDDRQAKELEEEAKASFTKSQDIKRQQAEEGARNWSEQIAEAKTRYTDFEKVALSDAPINEALAAQIVESDVAADIAYHIGKNPDVGRALCGMGAVDMARALGRLEAQLSAPKPKTVSTAPDPITPVRGKATASKDPGDMTPSEYRAWVDAGGKF